ncbi:MAG: hypothetical protein KDK44_01625 [Chlamydiia bacterium]|nr:hypothetical protein [Chlamydiia bacterium]
MYTLFRKGTEANNNRLEKKARAEFEKQKAADAAALAKQKTEFVTKYGELLEAILAKPAIEQYDEMVKLAGTDELALNWVVEGEDYFIELKGKEHTCRKAITKALYDVMVQNTVANEFGAIAEVLMDEKAEPVSVKAKFKDVRVSLEKYGIKKENIKLEEQGRVFTDLRFSVTRNEAKIHSQKISPSAATAIFKKLPGCMDGYQSDLAESVVPANQEELEEAAV